MDTYVDFTEMALDFVGKTGPITVDTEISRHNFFLRQDRLDFRKADVMTIGTPGDQITIADVRVFLTKVRQHMDRTEFGINNNSLFFGGIEEENGVYYFMWSS